VHDMVHPILENDARQRVLVLHASRVGAPRGMCDKGQGADTPIASPAVNQGPRHDPGIPARLDRCMHASLHCLQRCAVTTDKGHTQLHSGLLCTHWPARSTACLAPGVRMAHTCTSQYTKGPASRASRDIRTSDAMTAPGCLASAEDGVSTVRAACRACVVRCCEVLRWRSLTALAAVE